MPFYVHLVVVDTVLLFLLFLLYVGIYVFLCLFCFGVINDNMFVFCRQQRVNRRRMYDDGYYTQHSYPQYRRVVVDASGRVISDDARATTQPMTVLSHQQPTLDRPSTQVPNTSKSAQSLFAGHTIQSLSP